jgi:hypothetical protein
MIARGCRLIASGCSLSSGEFLWLIFALMG